MCKSLIPVHVSALLLPACGSPWSPLRWEEMSNNSLAYEVLGSQAPRMCKVMGSELISEISGNLPGMEQRGENGENECRPRGASDSVTGR